MTRFLSLASTALIAFGLLMACGGGPERSTGGDAAQVPEVRMEVPILDLDPDQMAAIQEDDGALSNPPERDTHFEPAQNRGGRLVIASLGSPKSFNLIVANETSSTDLLRQHVYRPLLNWNNVAQRVEPGLAYEWSVDETGLVWTFHLREGLVFSDSTPIDSESVARYFRLVYTEGLANASRDMVMVNGEEFTVEAPDPLTVVIRTPSVYSAMEFQASQNIYPMPAAGWEDALQSDSPAEAINEMFQVNVDVTEIVGSGPFVIASFTDGVRTVLRRNPNYQVWDADGNRLPNLDEIIFIDVPDLDARRLRFESGETDAYGILPAEYASLRDEQIEGNYSMWDLGPALGSSFFWFNLRQGINEETQEPFVDPAKQAWFLERDFRNACSHAVNRDDIIRAVFRGRATEETSFESSSNDFWHNPNSTHHGYDPARANALLDGLAYLDHDGDGIREHPEGTPIRFTMITNNENGLRMEVLTLLQRQLREVGIDMVPSPMEFNALITRINDTFHYEACLLGLTGSIDPTDGLNVFRSSGRTHLWNPLQETPATEAEARLDELCDQMLGTLDREVQRQCYFEIQDILGRENFTIHTVTPNGYLATRNTIGNWAPGVMRPVALWNSASLWRRAESAE